MLASTTGRVAVPENRTDFESFELRPFTPHIGAEIRGLDLSKPLTDLEAVEFDQAFREWMVLAIRDQSLTRDQHKAFGRRFGKLHVHPMHVGKHRGGDPEILPVVTTADVAYTAGDGWHTDVTCDEIPPLASMLYVKETPECGGGDTAYANMYFAYELLSETMKNFLEPLEAVHDGALPYVGAYKTTPPEGGYPRNRHPVITRHPETGRKILYVNAGFTSHIVGLAPAESRAILDLLFAQIATTPRLHCRVTWEPRTMTIWDNRCTQHHAVWDYYPYSRSGERVSVQGDKAPAR
jgi:taurine dioxygenase